MNAFSDMIMRSHPGTLPDIDKQIYDTEENILFMKKFVDIHVKLANYKNDLMVEAN